MSFNLGFVIAVVVVIAVTALIRKDGSRTKSGRGPSGWGAGHGGDYGGDFEGHDGGSDGGDGGSDGGDGGD
jgi:hypothetical protein